MTRKATPRSRRTRSTSSRKSSTKVWRPYDFTYRLLCNLRLLSAGLIVLQPLLRDEYKGEL